MARLHLFELEDFPWFPAVLRDAGTAYLRFMQEKTGAANVLAPALGKVIGETGEKRIVDLCSGGAGPIPAIVERLGKDGVEVSATLTDFYPNVGVLSDVTKRDPQRLSFQQTPVDATSVPSTLRGLRTVFNAFHHFQPALAKRILADAARSRQPIAVYEIARRSPAAVVAILFSPLLVLLTMPFLRPFRWPWALLTYVLPVIPLFVLWDGVVSCLRVYSPEELRALVADIDAPDWTWDIGELPVPGAPIPVTYLVGKPTA